MEKKLGEGIPPTDHSGENKKEGFLERKTEKGGQTLARKVGNIAGGLR